MLTWLRRRHPAAPPPAPVIGRFSVNPPPTPQLPRKLWHHQTREEKLSSAPYSLGWEEGYAAARRAFARTGSVPDVFGTDRRLR